MRGRIAIALILASVSACASQATPAPTNAPKAPLGPWLTALDRDSPLVGKVWSATTGTTGDASALFAAVARADFVLLGEQHDNADHHRLQAAIVESIARAGRRPAIVLEMLEPDDDAKVAQYRASASATAEGLGPAIGWEKNGWPAWRLYRPIADAAFAYGLPLLSGNLPHATVRRLVHEGAAALSAEDAARLDLGTTLAAPLEASLEAELVASHCGQLPPAFVAPMALAQRARDGQMADHMTSAGASPVVLVAGAGHARRDRGVPVHLTDKRPAATIVSIGFVEVEHDHLLADAYAERFGAARLPFDFVWFTPRASDDDPCKDMKMPTR